MTYIALHATNRSGTSFQTEIVLSTERFIMRYLSSIHNDNEMRNYNSFNARNKNNAIMNFFKVINVVSSGGGERASGIALGNSTNLYNIYSQPGPTSRIINAAVLAIITEYIRIKQKRFGTFVTLVRSFLFYQVSTIIKQVGNR